MTVSDPTPDDADPLFLSSDESSEAGPPDAGQPALGHATDDAGYRMLEGRGAGGYSLLNPPEHWKADSPEQHRVERVLPRGAAANALPPRRHGALLALIGCNVIVFLASVCVMVLELVASRLIAKHVGSSLYTWTSVIGVVLAGITAGNFLGGWLADRFPARRLLSWLFLVASVSCFSVLWLDRIVAHRERPLDVDWPTWVFLTVLQMFFLPALALGTISPVVASLALQYGRKTGITVGNVYAWGAMGSIIGTFLTGFWLIDQFGTRAIIAGTAGTLALLGVAVASSQKVFRASVVLGWMQFMLVMTAAATASSDRFASAGDWLARRFVSRDPQVAALVDFKNGHWSDVLDIKVRQSLQKRIALGEFILLDSEEQKQLDQWLRSGNREHLTPEFEAAIDRLAVTHLQPRTRINDVRDRAESIGRELHELGLLLFLRDDQPGQYHDESNYSYINVSTDNVGADEVRSLRLDKLAHSYFNFDDPTHLYYEYELIYAEATERAVDSWKRDATVTINDFPGRADILKKMPEWARFDTSKNELAVRLPLTDEKRRVLLRLTPHGDWWIALEELAAMTRQAQWSGFSTVGLKAIPHGAAQLKLFQDRLNFEDSFGSLNAFHPLSAEDIETLAAAGSAADVAPWREAVKELQKQKRDVRTFFIGGGGFVFPRWIEHHYPGSKIDVAELDPAVKLAVQKEMGLPQDNATSVHTFLGDARNVVDDVLRDNHRLVAANQTPVKYDFIYGDAFNDFSVPWHLTTTEFMEKLQAMMDPEHGVYMFNIIDLWPRTNVEPKYAGDDDSPLPQDMLLDDEVFAEWQSAGPGYDGLEVMLRHSRPPLFAVRGLLTQALRERLEKRFDHPAMPAAFAQLERESKNAVGGRFLSSCTLTLSRLFPNVYVFSTQYGMPNEDRDTFVLICSMRPLNFEDLPETGQHWTTRPFASQERASDGTTKLSGGMESLMATARGLVLTDDFAPVDNLLRPVFTKQD